MSPHKSTGVSTTSNTFTKKKGRTQRITFDEDARREYLTGFHKRNVERKENRRKWAQEKERLERLELRKQRRQELAERAAENVKAVETALGMTESDAEISANFGNEDALLQDQDLEYENDEKLAIVTVVDHFSVDTLRHGEDQADIHSETNLSLRNKSSDPIDSSSVTKRIPKPHPHKVKYETKAARKTEKARQRARKMENARKPLGDKSKSKRQMRR